MSQPPILEVPNKRTCQHPIELGGGNVVYCVLLEGHKGRCEPEHVPCSKCRALTRWWAKNGEKE